VALNIYGGRGIVWAQLWTDEDGRPSRVIGGTSFDTSSTTDLSASLQGPFYAWSPIALVGGTSCLARDAASRP
jgi:hypothetical protein